MVTISLPKYIIVEILRYFFTYSRNFRNHRAYTNRLGLVCKDWKEIVGRIYEFVGGTDNVSSAQTFHKFLSVKDKRTLKLSLSFSQKEVQDEYERHNALDNSITSIDLSPCRTVKLRKSSSLTSVSTTIERHISLECYKILNNALQDVWEDLEDLKLTLRTGYREMVENFSIKELVDGPLRKPSKISRMTIDISWFSDNSELFINDIERILPEYFNKLKSLSISQAKFTKETLNQLIMSLTLLEYINLSICFGKKENGFNQFLEGSITHSKSLKRVILRIKDEDLSMKSLVSCLNGNKILDELSVVCPEINNDSSEPILNSTLSKILFQNTVWHATLSNIIYLQWGCPSNLKSVQYESPLQLSHCHINSTSIEYKITSPKDLEGINSLPFPHMKKLYINASGFIGYLNIVKLPSIITEIYLNLPISFEEICDIISSDRLYVFFVYGSIDGCVFKRFSETLLKNTKLRELSLRSANFSDPTYEFETSLFKILENNHNLNKLELMPPHRYTSLGFLIKLENIIKSHKHIQTLILGHLYTHVENLLHKYLIVDMGMKYCRQQE